MYRNQFGIRTVALGVTFFILNYTDSNTLAWSLKLYNPLSSFATQPNKDAFFCYQISAEYSSICLFKIVRNRLLILTCLQVPDHNTTFLNFHL